MRHNFRDEVGNKYHKLTVLERAPNNKFGHTMWKCKCDCGTIKIIAGSSLRHSTKSCGCIHKELMFERRLGDAVFKIILRNILTDCKIRGHDFDLDLDDIKRVSILPCTYCGREPYEKKCRYQKKRSKAEDDCLILNGIDRIIPSLGYTKNNIAPCCKYCNRAKSDLSVDEFKNLIKLIYKNYCNEDDNY